MNQAAQKCPRGQNNARRRQVTPIFADNSCNLLLCTAFTRTRIIKQQITNRRFDDGDIVIFIQKILNGGTIQSTVSLRARAMHSRTTRFIQHAELDSGAVNRPPHQPVKRIDLADKMAFAQPANCRIARHFANPVSAHRDQRYRRAHTRGCSGRLTARMTSTNNNDIKCRFHSLTLSIQLSGSDLICDSIIHDPMGGEHIIDYGFLPHCSVIHRLKYKNVSRETFLAEHHDRKPTAC